MGGSRHFGGLTGGSSFVRSACGCNRPRLCGRLPRMTFAEFQKSLAAKAPPRVLAPALVALWWAERGDWDKAHKIVMDQDGRDAAWVHAYLHRVEGDAGNSAYWYRQAGKPVAAAALDREWKAIATALLAAE